MRSAESEARKALQRLRRALEKSARELEALDGALRRAEGTDFPEEEYAKVAGRIDALCEFCDAEARRLQEKILHAGGLEAGRIRRSSE